MVYDIHVLNQYKQESCLQKKKTQNMWLLFWSTLTVNSD